VMYYEIEGTPVRLAGSLHILPAAAPSLPDWVWRAYEWSETIILEHDVSQAREYASLKAGDSLERHLPAPLWNQLVAAWPTDRPLADISSLKLWMAVPRLPLSQVSVAAGVEVQFTQRAGEDKKPITYLETMAEVAGLADSLPDATLREALSIALAELPNARRNFMDLHEAWLSRDLERLEAVVARTPLQRMPEIRAHIADMRNERWLPRILAMSSSDQRILIAPGALHLPGKNGLLALLQRAGHRTRLISEALP